MPEGIFLKVYLGRVPLKAEIEEKLGHAQRRASFLSALIWFDFSEDGKRKSETLAHEEIAKLDMLLYGTSLKDGYALVKSQVVVSPFSKKYKEIKLNALSFLKTYLNNKILK